jgi:predicted O-linked N-acetylglucosamine transferase (SPINDLY family)
VAVGFGGKTGIGVALGGAISIAGLTTFFRATVDGLDKLNDLSDATGATIENLSALEDIAGRTGTSVDTVGDALVKMNQNLGKGGAALQSLGLDVSQLDGLTTDQKFIKIADAIGKIQDPAKRTAAAMEMLGKGGVNLINTSVEGAGGIRMLMQEAADLGITLNEVDAEKFAQVNDSFDLIEKSIKGAAQTMLIEFAPAIDAIAKKAVNLGKAFNSWLKNNRPVHYQFYIEHRNKIEQPDWVAIKTMVEGMK